MTKSELRQKIKALIKNENKDFLKKESIRICDEIVNSQIYKESTVVLAYMPLFDEVDVIPVIKNALKENKKVAVPKVLEDSNKMIFYYLDAAGDLSVQTEKGYYGILEPKLFAESYSTESVSNKSFFVENCSCNENILILVPGRAFSSDGKRLGRGKGFYDVFLSEQKKIIEEKKLNLKIKNAGVCYKCQIAEDIPVCDNDVLVDVVFC